MQLYLSFPRLALTISFATLMVLLPLSEMNYFHILQILHSVRVCGQGPSRLPTRVQLARFICVANEATLGSFDGLPRLLLLCREGKRRTKRGEENLARGAIKKKPFISGRQMLSSRGRTPVIHPPLCCLPSLFFGRLLAGSNETLCNIHLIFTVYLFIRF